MQSGRPCAVIIGTGGLTAALCLQRAGVDVVVVESVAALRPPGVGINLLLRDEPRGARALRSRTPAGDRGNCREQPAAGSRAGDADRRGPQKNTAQLLPTALAGQKIKYIVLDDATDPSAATQGVFTYTPTDHVGLDQRARVLTRVEKSSWKLPSGG